VRPTDMSEKYSMARQPVDVQARLVPRFLWSTASIDVFLDKQSILRTGGKFESHRFTFCDVHAFRFHATAELSWGYGLLFSFPYKLVIVALRFLRHECAFRIGRLDWLLRFCLQQRVGDISSHPSCVTSLTIREAV